MSHCNVYGVAGKYITCFLTLAAVFLGALTTGAETIYKSDFSRSNVLNKEWTILAGRWQTAGSNGGLRQVVGAPQSLGRILLKQAVPPNIEVTLTYTCLGGKSAAGFGGGILLRYPDAEGDYIQVALPTHGQKGISLIHVTRKKKNGSLRNHYRKLTECDSKLIEQNRAYTIRLRLCGPALTIWLDGEELIEFEKNPAVENGSFGLSTYGSSIDFKNIVINKIEN